MDSASSADAGMIDTGPAAPSTVFVYDNGDPIEFWVHPSYPSRSALITVIKAHGGAVTHDFEMAHFAVASKAMSDKQLEIVKRPESSTTAISGAWILECVKSGTQIAQDGYLIWKLRPIDMSDRPPTSSENPSPSTRAQDESFFLWACEKLFNENTLVQWVEIYRWCADETKCRPESFWSSLNGPGSGIRSKAQRIYRAVVNKAIGSDALKQVEDTKATTPPSQTSTTAPTKPSRSGMHFYSEAEHRALIEYFATDPVGTKAHIWERFHQMQPQRSAGAWREHVRHFEGFLWEQAKRLKAGMPYELFPPDYSADRIAKPEAAEEHDKDDREQNEPPTAHDSDSSYSVLDADEDGPDDIHPPPANSGRLLKIRYSSEERRDMVAHLAKYPTTGWENYTSKHATRTRSSLSSYHKRHPSLDRLAAELTRRSKDKRGGQDVAHASEAGPSNIRTSRPPKRHQPFESSSSKARSPKRPRLSDPGTYRTRPSSSSRLSPTTPATAFEASTSQSYPSLSHTHNGRLSPANSGAQPQTRRKKFDGEDWKLAMQFVLSRDPPEGPLENTLSWKAFAKTHTTLDWDGWLELYYSDLSLFKSMEAHRA